MNHVGGVHGRVPAKEKEKGGGEHGGADEAGELGDDEEQGLCFREGHGGAVEGVLVLDG